MWVDRMWGPISGNIIFFQDLINRGFQCWSQAPWTINAELFPHMTFGQAYDLLMGMNISSWFVTALGAYNLRKQLRELRRSIGTKADGKVMVQ